MAGVPHFEFSILLHLLGSEMINNVYYSSDIIPAHIIYCMEQESLQCLPSKAEKESDSSGQSPEQSDPRSQNTQSSKEEIFLQIRRKGSIEVDSQNGQRMPDPDEVDESQVSSRQQSQSQMNKAIQSESASCPGKLSKKIKKQAQPPRSRGRPKMKKRKCGKCSKVKNNPKPRKTIYDPNKYMCRSSLRKILIKRPNKKFDFCKKGRITNRKLQKIEDLLIKDKYHAKYVKEQFILIKPRLTCLNEFNEILRRLEQDADKYTLPAIERTRS